MNEDKKGLISRGVTRVGVMISGLVAVAVGFLVGGQAHAAVDADVASSTALIVTTLKDNIIGAITNNLASLIAIGVFIMLIFLIWKIVKRFSKG